MDTNFALAGIDLTERCHCGRTDALVRGYCPDHLPAAIDDLMLRYQDADDRDAISEAQSWLRDGHDCARDLIDATECTEEEVLASPWLRDMARVQVRLAAMAQELGELLSAQQRFAIAQEERRQDELSDMADAAGGR